MNDRWQHQPREIAHATEQARALFWSPRTGKTRTMVKSSEVLFSRGLTRVLVIAPQFVCRTVWADEYKSQGWATWDLSHGKLELRRNILKSLRDFTGVQIVLVNWEALSPLIEDLLRWKPQLVIADEVHYAKSASAARSRALHRLGKVASYRRMLTGTPTPRDYIDLYSQFKFLAPEIFGTNKAKFIEQYCELDFFKRPKFYKNLPEMRSKMLSVTSVFDRKKEWKDLPPSEIRRRIDLPEKARKLYQTLVEKTVAEVEGVHIDAAHKLARLAKLQQLTAGFITDEDGTVHWVHQAKIDAVVEELRDLLASGEKVVVFYHFAEEGREIERRIRLEYGALVGRIGGDTVLGMRENLQKSFLSSGPESLRVMVMQDSLGIGISLKSAAFMIRTSYPLDYAAYNQSNERIYEPGKPLTYITLDVPNSVDAFGRRVCTRKEQASSVLMSGGFRNAALGLNLEMAA